MEVATKRLLHPAGKNTGKILVPCCTWKGVPTAISGGVNISEIPGCHLLRQMGSQCRSKKLLHGLVSHELTACLSVFNLFFNAMNYGHINNTVSSPLSAGWPEKISMLAKGGGLELFEFLGAKWIFSGGA